MATNSNPVELLEQTFELYSEYVALTDSAILGQVNSPEQEFYAPPPSAQGLIIR